MDQNQTIFTVWSSVHGYSGYQSKSPLIFTIPKESKHKESCPRHQMQGHLTLLLFDICFRCHSKERETHQYVKSSFPKGTEGFNFPGKDRHPVISPVPLLKYLQGSLGLGKGPTTKVILLLLPMRADNPHKSQCLLIMASSYHYKNSRFFRSVLCPR